METVFVQNNQLWLVIGTENWWSDFGSNVFFMFAGTVVSFYATIVFERYKRFGPEHLSDADKKYIASEFVRSLYQIDPATRSKDMHLVD